MNETLDDLQPVQQKKTTQFLLFGIILLAVYAIVSGMAMNDLWKCHVDKMFASFFGTSSRFCDSGMIYTYISLVALAGSAVMFFLRVRKNGSTNWLVHGIIAVVLVIIGFIFFFNANTYDPSFMEYIQQSFYPFWAWTLAGFFAVCCVASFLNKSK